MELGKLLCFNSRGVSTVISAEQSLCAEFGFSCDAGGAVVPAEGAGGLTSPGITLGLGAAVSRRD